MIIMIIIIMITIILSEIPTGRHEIQPEIVDCRILEIQPESLLYYIML